MILDRPEEPGKKYALTFTILVHVGLVAALFLGVQWKRSQPEVMEVELWASRPMPAQQVVPPPPPPPEVKPQPKPLPKLEPKPEPLPPKKPDIAVKEEKKKPEPKKPEPKPEPPKPEPKKPEPKPQPQPKFDFSKELADYASKIRMKVRGNMMPVPGIQGNPEAVFDVTQLPTGEVLDIKLKRSSGNPALDGAIERAIRKSSPLPKPDDPSLGSEEH